MLASANSDIATWWCCCFVTYVERKQVLACGYEYLFCAYTIHSTVYSLHSTVYTSCHVTFSHNSLFCIWFRCLLLLLLPQWTEMFRRSVICVINDLNCKQTNSIDYCAYRIVNQLNAKRTKENEQKFRFGSCSAAHCATCIFNWLSFIYYLHQIFHHHSLIQYYYFRVWYILMIRSCSQPMNTQIVIDSKRTPLPRIRWPQADTYLQ